MEALAGLTLVLFVVATAALSAYGLHLYVLLWLFIRRRRARRAEQRRVIERYQARTPDADWPTVTSQIPIYNEADVCARVVRAVAAMRYPPGKHLIQILDDSTDHTSARIDEVVGALVARGARIDVVRRPERTGYKAGALAYGMSRTDTEFVAVFDADFVPPPQLSSEGDSAAGGRAGPGVPPGSVGSPEPQ